MKLFYAFHFYDGRRTTTGNPNKRTGRCSVAGRITTFKSKLQRDQWVIEHSKRMAVNAKEARQLCLGQNMANYIDTIKASLVEENDR